jgi:hypothetical protein
MKCGELIDHHTGKYTGVEQTCVSVPNFLPVTNEDIINRLLQGNKKIYLKHIVAGTRLVPKAKTVVKIYSVEFDRSSFSRALGR